MRKINVIDSHTAGEPTRVVLDGGPDLGVGPLSERLRLFRDQHDDFRAAVVNEPRGSDVLVGALLVAPVDPGSAAAVLFFNNVGPLGMCGHGLIGVLTTLAYLGRIESGRHRVETPVGGIEAALHPDGRVSFRNVPSYRLRRGVTVDVPGHGPVTGDIAWGGNWFFLTEGHGQELTRARAEELTAFGWEVRKALARAGHTGADGAEIDHVELFGPPSAPENDSRNFVLCPGKAYDRSPCGTGTSAKLACLAADGKLPPGRLWRQESLLGSVFEGSVEPSPGGQWLPTITGRAFITAEATLILDPADPFCRGIP